MIKALAQAIVVSVFKKESSKIMKFFEEKTAVAKLGIYESQASEMVTSNLHFCIVGRRINIFCLTLILIF